MFVAIAIHYPKPEYKDAFFSYMARVKQIMQGNPGLIEIEGFRDIHMGRLVGISRWESEESFQSALPKLFAISGRDENWSAHPDEVFSLTS